MYWIIRTWRWLRQQDEVDRWRRAYERELHSHARTRRLVTAQLTTDDQTKREHA